MTLQIFSPLSMAGGISPVLGTPARKDSLYGALVFEAVFAWGQEPWVPATTLELVGSPNGTTMVLGGQGAALV